MSDVLCPGCGQSNCFVFPGPCNMCGCVVCIKCSKTGFVAPGPCAGCGYCEKRTCVLSLEDGTVVRVMNLRTRFDQSWAQGYFSEDAKFWDRKCQFHISFDGQNWVLEAGNSVNDTMVNGVCVSPGSAQPIAETDRISVGKASKSIEKTVLVVSFS